MIENLMKMVVEPRTTTELAPLFDCSPRTLRKYIAKFRKKLGRRIGRRWSIYQIEIIIEHLGGTDLIIEVQPTPIESEILQLPLDVPYREAA